GCTQARGIWGFNAVNNKNIVYRRNTVKVEAMPGNLKNPEDGAQVSNEQIHPYYNDDVNYAIAAVTFSERAENLDGPIADPIIFEDNRLIGNVNLVVIGEGYGICNSVWMYRTKLEKIEHDSEYFRPVRIGFWYWDTGNNRMIDNEWIGISEKEKTPFFFGGTGKMEIRYGESKTLTFKDRNGAPLAGKRITLTLPPDNHTVDLPTDAGGRSTFDLLTVRYYKFGNSLENGGVAGVFSRTDYRQYTFTLAGYAPLTVSLAQLKDSDTLTMQ
ncbi:MAG: carboxypeptidase-like regulatory domain-containing protein, partial [Tannerella sp.]|nr:carboxypeptidase-like regulatory domain-containing protein [Tannerella sp.]